MRSLLVLPPLLSMTATAFAERIESAYTQLVPETHCTTFAGAGEDDGDWANMVCDGYRGYPVFIYYSDARESLFYGFPPAGDLAPAWEGFDGFNHAGPTVEWRIARDGDFEIPFATIHRWFVSDFDDAERQIEVLAVEKIGQPYERDGCAVGYVVATGNSDANEKARRIADTQARSFACGDQPTIDAGSVPVPPFSRQE